MRMQSEEEKLVNQKHQLKENNRFPLVNQVISYAQKEFYHKLNRVTQTSHYQMKMV